MNGMARIFNGNQAKGPADLMNSAPMAWNANYQILSGQTFDTSAAVRGSVASWAAGDFNYDLGSQWSDQLTSGNLDEATAVAISALDISESTAGFFNIPVCRVFDLASFPSASPQAPPCACAYPSAVSETYFPLPISYLSKAETHYRQAARVVALRNSKHTLRRKSWIYCLRPRLLCRNLLLRTMCAERSSILVLTERPRRGGMASGLLNTTKILERIVTNIFELSLARTSVFVSTH